jgi:hypothetical protein
MRELREDAGPVSRFQVGVDGAPVRDVGHGLQRFQQHIVVSFARDSGHEANATGIVLEAGVV